MQQRSRVLFFVMLLSLAAPFGAARAEPADPNHQLLVQAEKAEVGARPQDALALYQALLRAEPDTPRARVARARIEWIQARSEDDYRPLAQLLRMQHTPPAALTQADVTAFERTAGALPQGILRTESRALIGNAWRLTLNDPVQAERFYRTWLQDPMPNEGFRQQAMTGLAFSRSDQGHVLEAMAIMKEAGFTRVEAYWQLKEILMARIGTPISLLLLGLFALAILVFVVPRLSGQALKDALTSGRLLAIAYLVVPPTVMAHLYPSNATIQFDQLTGALAAMILLSLVCGSALARKTTPRWAVTLVASTAALACFGAGFLLFRKTEVLEGLLLWRGL